MIKGRNVDKDLLTTNNVTIFDLSGSAASEMCLFRPKNDVAINSITITYPEATSADAGVVIKVGTASNDDEFFTVTSEVSKAAGYSRTYTPSEMVLATVAKNTPVYVAHAGGKTGTGTAFVSISYTVL